MTSGSAELLRWYKEAGVDEAISDTPINRLRVQTQEALQATRLQPAPSPVATTPKTTSAAAQHAPEYDSFRAPLMPTARAPHVDAAIKEARMLADAATTRSALMQAIQGFEGCALKKTARNTVFCDGNPEAKIMLIGEAPGQSEDEQGIPFCGVSGQLLDAMLGSIGLNRSNCYITNTIFWRPPANRPPSDDEIDICRPFVEKHIALIVPKLIILVGGTATKAVLQKHVGVTKLRGRFYDYNNQYLNKEIPTSALFHPSYLLRSPIQKRLAWQDLLFAKEFIVKNL